MRDSNWFGDHPELATELRACADDLNVACMMHEPAEKTQSEIEIRLCSFRKDILLEKFEAYASAIEAFTGIRYSFFRTNTHYGIGDDSNMALYEQLSAPEATPGGEK